MPDDLPILQLVVLIVAIVANAFSGIAAITRFGPVMATLGPALERAGVPTSWLVFPIGTLKLAGAIGLLLGLFGVALVGIAAAAGLVLYFVCAVYTHLRVGDNSVADLAPPGFFLALAVAALAINVA